MIGFVVPKAQSVVGSVLGQPLPGCQTHPHRFWEMRKAVSVTLMLVQATREQPAEQSEPPDHCEGHAVIPAGREWAAKIDVWVT